MLLFCLMLRLGLWTSLMRKTCQSHTGRTLSHAESSPCDEVQPCTDISNIQLRAAPKGDLAILLRACQDTLKLREGCELQQFLLQLDHNSGRCCLAQRNFGAVHAQGLSSLTPQGSRDQLSCFRWQRGDAAFATRTGQHQVSIHQPLLVMRACTCLLHERRKFVESDVMTKWVSQA